MLDINLAETKQTSAGMLKTKWILNVIQIQGHCITYEGDCIVAVPDSPYKRTKYINISNHARKLAEIDRVVTIIFVDGGRRNLDNREREIFEHSCKEQSLSIGPIVKLNMKSIAIIFYEGPQGTPGTEHMETNGEDATYCPGTRAFMNFLSKCRDEDSVKERTLGHLL
jgi:hypothetical protein